MNATQVNYAREVIEKLRYLEVMPIETVWPYLHYICCCLTRRRKKPFLLSLKKSLRSRLDIEMPKSDRRFMKDPFLRLGYGIHSYFLLMRQLMCMMCLVMILAVPLMFVYASHGALIHNSADYFFNQFSLGNIGGASSMCAVTGLKSDIPTKLMCSTGLVSI